ncbi:hypothetical protein CTAYLR_005522 [Chrysophaeum taylorii]|uniref:Bromo domain-containing protein n=1 Tax=Chrysophaeum taylorii TaxID=2483200 RepID=A0AAD7XEG8_9STRA|nr:hypothetical protein CTAYLR_005522 [Chrysophaeum taylorii]
MDEETNASLFAAVSDPTKLRAWREKKKRPLDEENAELEDALWLLDGRYGQLGRGSARAACAEALRRRLEQEAPTKALVEACVPFVAIPSLRSVPVQVLEQLARRGQLPSNVAKALDALPDDSFSALPLDVRQGVYALSEARFSRTWTPLVDKWLQRSPFLARKSSARRRASEPSLYASIAELTTTEPLIEKAVRLVCERGEPATLLVDILAGAPGSAASARARRLAGILDGVAVASAWSDQTISRLKAAVRPQEVVVVNPKIPLAARLEKAWHALRRADSKNWFANPVTDAVAPGYSKKIDSPMDLGTMRTKLGRAAPKGSYESVDEFEADVRKIVDNCRNFNGPESPIAADADRLWQAWLLAKPVVVATPPREEGSSPIWDAAGALLLSEPFAYHLAVETLCDDLELALDARELPNAKQRVKDLARLLGIFDAAAGTSSSATNTTMMMMIGARTHLPALMVAAWHARRRKPTKKKKHKPLLAALTTDQQHHHEEEDQEEDHAARLAAMRDDDTAPRAVQRIAACLLDRVVVG